MAAPASPPRSICALFALLLPVVATPGASAATYFVDNSGTSACSNSLSSGSETQPWCTITYGIARLKGGDELVVKQGTYQESVYISGPAGTAERPTVIRTYPGHLVTIRGTGNTGRVKITSTSHLTFDGFAVTNFNQGIFVEGGAHHITIQNCVVHDVGQEGIHVRQNSSDILIQGCTVYNTERIGGCCNGEGIYIGTGSAGPLDNTHNVIVRDNVIHDVTDEAIELKPGTHDSVVENNTISNCRDLGPWIGSAIEYERQDLGMQTWNTDPGHVIRGNLIHDCYVGIRVGSGVEVYNNVIHSTLGGRPGIVVGNPDGDSFTRHVYHNTIAMASDAVALLGGTSDVLNNVGPAMAGNIPWAPSLVVDAAAGDFHLAPGSAAIDAGLDLGDSVPLDRDGTPRPLGAFPDHGAYEFGQAAGTPSAPRNLRIVPGGP